ncbi:MAG: protein kinase [Planctomycetes bacterium]|nr:protein kinase [Planctomycetota bacterium]
MEDDRLDDIIAQYVERLNAGGRVDREEVERDHPEWAREILARLETFVQLGAGRESLPSETIGDFRLIRQIGRGGMGIVYEAWQTSMDRPVALKVLPGGVLSDLKTVVRFEREARIAGRLEHPNIVTVHGLGVADNTPYYAMEYVEGETLAQVLARRKAGGSDSAAGPLDATVLDLKYCLRVADAFAGVADGLQHAHEKGIIHRDIKPSNLILDRAGRLRILDFGLARLEGQDTLTLSTDIVGTPAYMSPEQARARKVAIDHRTDIYSLGATLYEVLGGRPPIVGKDYRDTITQIIARDPAPLRRENPRIPKDLETIVLKCLQKDPADRFGTAEALAQDLRRLVRGDPIEARPQPAWERFTRRIKRQRVRCAAFGLALLLAAVTVLFIRQVRINAEVRWAAARARDLAAYDDHLARAVSWIQQGEMQLDVMGVGESDVDPSGLFGIHRLERVVKESPLAPLDRAIPELEHAERLPLRDFEVYYQWARVLDLQGRDREVLEKLEALFALAPTFVPGRMLAAAVCRDLGEVARAQHEAAQAENAASEPWEKAWLAARAAEGDHRWQDAAKAYGELLASPLSKGLPYRGFAMETRLRRGLVRLRAKELAGALTDFIIAHHEWPDAMEPLLLLGTAWYREGRLDAARAAFEALHAGRPDAEKDHAAVWIAITYTYLKDYDAALRWSRKIGIEVLRERLGSYYLTQLEQYAAAEAAAERAIELDPGDAPAHHMLAIALLRQKRFDPAIAACDRAIALAPDDFGAYHTKGLCYYEQRDFKRAAEFTRQSLERRPDYPISLSNLGVSLVRLGQIKEGLAKLDRAYEIQPTGLTCTFLALTYKIIGVRGYPTRMVDLLEEGIAIDPKTWLAWGNLGYVLYEYFHDYEKAEEKLLEAVRLNPEWYIPHAHLGQVLEHLGRDEEAKHHYREAAKLADRKELGEIVPLGNTMAKACEYPEIRAEGVEILRQVAESMPGDSRLHAEYAAALFANERYEDSRAAVERALALDADNVFARTLRADLEEQAGRPAQAVSDFLAVLDAKPARFYAYTFERIRRLLVLRKDMDFGDSLAALRKRLEEELAAGSPDPAAVWDTWLTAVLLNEGRGLPEVIAEMERLPTPAEDPRRADRLWALTSLRDTETIRIDCGGQGDRLFIGGAPSETNDASGDDTLLRTARVFAPEEQGPARYRIPVAPGSYLVKLTFDKEKTAMQTLESQGAFLDIEFDGPEIRGIEVSPAETK